MKNRIQNPESRRFASRFTFHASCAFTLIEMLTVIAIIAILTGILYPALRTIRDGPKKAQARADIRRIEMALQGYYNEYGRWPPTPASAEEFFAMMNGNVKPYDGSSLATSYTNNNRRVIRFIEIDKKFVNSSNEFLDPWGNPYLIAVDNGGKAFGAGWVASWWGDCTAPNVTATADDGIIMDRCNGSYTGMRSIGIYSFGPNGTNQDAQGPQYDDITSWY